MSEIALTTAEDRRVGRDRKPPVLSFPVDGVDGNGIVADQDFARTRNWDWARLNCQGSCDSGQKCCKVFGLLRHFRW